MFQGLRQGNQLFILHKEGKPSLEMGTVTSVSKQLPKFPTTPMFGQPEGLEITVKVGGSEMKFQNIPAYADIADSGEGIIIADSRDSMNTEVMSLKQRSVDTLSCIDLHKEIIESCDAILSTLNPEYAERQAQQAEIASLKQQMSDLMQMNKDLIAKLNLGSDASQKQE